MSKPKACQPMKLSKPVAIDPAALERRKTLSRLRRARQGLEAFLFRLETLHADRSGSFRLCYPALPLLPDEAAPKLRGIARTKREAANGCPHASAWLRETEDLREKIETLRNTKLPERDPDYSGPWVIPTDAMRAGKARPWHYLQGRDAAQIVAEHQARRRERGAALLSEFVREAEEAAVAKAAANVPH